MDVLPPLPPRPISQDPTRAVVEVLRAVQSTSISEIEVEWEGGRVRVTREPSLMDPVSAPPSSDAEPQQTAVVVRSAHVGIFHREPEARLPEPGDAVSEGQTLAEVETLGIRNPVTAPVDGTLAEALLDDGAAVEYGHPLFVIDPIHDG